LNITLEQVKNYGIQDYLNKKFYCNCGRVHAVDINEILISSSALYQIPDLLTNYGYKKIFMVSDRNTYEAAGRLIEKLLIQNEIHYNKYTFACKEELVPDERALGRLLVEVDKETDLILAVGSGTINDLCRMLSFKLNIPYFIAATAPSMDGYASNVSPLIVNNLKVTYQGSVPKVIIADVDVIKRAPMKMILAGFGDLLGKLTCLCDWKLGSIVNGEYHCSVIEQIVRESLEKCMSNIEGIKNREDEAVKSLLEGLILSGIAMSFSGNSRPASGAEHHISHFWEMMFLLQGKTPELHGTKVTITTIASAKLYNLLITSKIDFDKAVLNARQFNKEKWIRYIEKAYGAAAEDVLALIRQEMSLEPEGRIRRIESIKNNWKAIVDAVEEYIPNSDELRGILRDCGAAVSPSEIGVDEQLVYDSIMAAKDLRPRYTILQIITDLGLLEEFAYSTKKYLSDN
jgi:glycerol-1-phosphate dehydrogenase [NAD(P)+]